MPMNTCVLGSGSKGNCTAVWNENTVILIDAGRLSVTYIRTSLARIGLDISDVDAVLITHCHTDHFNDSTYRLCQKPRIPIYCSVASWRGAMRRKSNRKLAALKDAKLLEQLKPKEFRVGDFTVTPFPVSHASRYSAGDPVGFTIKNGKKKMSYATDLGRMTKDIERHISDSDILVIESNHDVEMEMNSGRHPDTIQWVIGNTGHLSNEQCAATLGNILRASKTHPRHIALAHLSEDCNEAELALSTSRMVIEEMNITGVNLLAAEQKTPTPLLSVD